jgi:chaperonin GroES
MLKPLHDRILIKRFETEQKSAGGILLVSDDKSTKAEVLAVGDGYVDKDGKVTPLYVQVGDIVLLSKKEIGVEVKLEEGTFLVVREGELVGVLERKNNNG